MTDLPIWGTTKPSPPDAVEVQRIDGIPYFDDPEADALRHRLDLFIPRDKKNFPVVVLIHGGAWMLGDNRCCGLYSSVGEFLASRGIGAVLPNYRLSPGVKHPEHMRDVARAFAWTRAHIAEHGGDPDQIFLAGHSAGGHLVSLLATDSSYLESEGLSAEDVRGVIAVSGVYRIPPGNFDVTLGGPDSEAFRLNEIVPLRGSDEDQDSRISRVPGVPLTINLFGPAFGEDPEIRSAASPLNHIRPGLPPFLILCAEHDLPTLAGTAEEFHTALQASGCDARILRIDNRNHNSLMFQAISPDDPAAAAILEFIGDVSGHH